jgi:hypothetical protein
MSLPYETILLARQLVEREMRGAFPEGAAIADRPVAPEPPRLNRTRTFTAAVLHRAADAVAPAC